MRKEVEVKARIFDKKLIEEKLQDLECALSEPVRQEDAIYVNHNHPFDQHVPGNQYLRIRQSNNQALFTVKQPLSNDLDAIEHEVAIDDAEEMREILLMLGYREEIQVKKYRRKAQYGEYEICLDDVDALGSFIEVEKITDEEDSEAVQNELFEFLMSLGIRKEDRIEQGYDTLVYLEQKKN